MYCLFPHFLCFCFTINVGQLHAHGLVVILFLYNVVALINVLVLVLKSSFSDHVMHGRLIAYINPIV